MGRKSNQAIEREQNEILSILREAESPMVYNQILGQYAKITGSNMAYSTLRTRLDSLLAKGLVERTEARRLPRYSLVRTPSQQDSRLNVANAMVSSTADHVSLMPSIPLSEHAQQARAILMSDRMHRQPVTYDSAFLDAYLPGETWYLPAALREHLRRIGGTAFEGQPAGTYARDVMQRLIIDLSWASSKLEGNRYSRIDTQELVESGKSAEGASDHDRQMILNHKAAIEFLVENAEHVALDRYTVMSLHALLAENLLGNAEDEGRLRVRPIAVGESLYTPTAIPQLIEERFDKILHTARLIHDPIEQSFFTMVHLPYLQPFMDVNKRTSRLAANIPLIHANLCPLSFVDVPRDLYTQGTLAVYELNDISLLKDVYTWAYERSCAVFKVLREAMGQPDPIRLRYRTQLRALVNEVVADMISPDDLELRNRAVAFDVPTEDRELFVTAARRDLVGLRPEVLARYAVQPSQFEMWVAKFGAQRR